MIDLRYRPWDWDDWTFLSITGPASSDAANVFGAWAMSQGMEIEVLEEEDWIPLGEEE